MFQQGVVQLPYMAYDYASLNAYNYKDMSEKMTDYQREQNMHYYTRQINPISIVPLTPQTLDPSNLPCDIRPMLYAQGSANNNELLNIHNTTSNNPNLWMDRHPAHGGYHTQNEQTLNFIRPISAIQAGHATSIIDVKWPT